MAGSFEKHPRLTLTICTLVLLMLIAGMAEIILRFTIPYDIGYYTAVKKPGEYDYPYGKIYMNQDGYPDEEFDRTSTKPRIGYFGDSVTFGVGAGAGYRFSDLLQEKFPAYEHWTFSMIANGIEDDRVLKTAEEYNLNTVIYAFNLNDILPAPEKTTDGTKKKIPPLVKLQKTIWHTVDVLRGKSYLYTWLRTTVKNALTRAGYSHTGFKAAELYPDENRELIREVAGRIRKMDESLKSHGIKFCVLILPYEMQISNDAAQTYKSLGIHWEDGFEQGKTQQYLLEDLKGVAVYNGLKAFSGLKDTARVGEYFVYNQGDKIDFNHPGRAGHALLAQGLWKSHACHAFYN